MARFTWNDPRPAVLQITQQVADAIGQALVERACEYVPVDTGATRDSITYRVEQRGDSFVITIGAYTDYGVFIELGTVHWAGQPFLRPAVDAVAQSIAERFALAFQTLNGPSYAARVA